MRAVVQRVGHAVVTVEGAESGGPTTGMPPAAAATGTQPATDAGDRGHGRASEISRGLLVYLGVAADDAEGDVRYLARKVAGLRIFDDEAGVPNLSVAEVSGAVLVVSQFTLYGDTRKGRRPSYNRAAAPEAAERMYRRFIELVEEQGIPVATGVFRASMAVSSVNDGPFTILLDSRREF